MAGTSRARALAQTQDLRQRRGFFTGLEPLKIWQIDKKTGYYYPVGDISDGGSKLYKYEFRDGQHRMEEVPGITRE